MESDRINLLCSANFDAAALLFICRPVHADGMVLSGDFKRVWANALFLSPEPHPLA